MELKKVTGLNDIKQNDTIILTGGEYNKTLLKVEMVKVSKSDGVEIIVNKKKNYFFNMQMYLDGKSWVKEVVIVI